LNNYALTTHNHNGVYATASHTHSNYASINHTHSEYLTSSNISDYIYVTGTFSGQANVSLGFQPVLVLIGAISLMDDSPCRNSLILTRGATVGIGDPVGTSSKKITSSGFNLNGLQLVKTGQSYYYIAFRP